MNRLPILPLCLVICSGIFVSYSFVELIPVLSRFDSLSVFMVSVLQAAEVVFPLVVCAFPLVIRVVVLKFSSSSWWED